MSSEVKDRMENLSLEESIFKSLSNQKRRDILRVIGEKQEVTFTEIKNQVNVEDSPTLSYHLNELKQLLEQKNGKYRLSDLGQETYYLMNKINAYSMSASILSSFRKQLSAVIIANAILWAAALFAVTTFEGRPRLITTATFAALWFISNIILYSMSQKTKRQE